MPLSDDDIRGIVARAEQLHHAAVSADETETLVQAGEAIGIPRAFMISAVQERLGVQFRPNVGELVFAKSNDRFYAAEVLAEGEHHCQVRFLRGGDRTVALDELLPCPFFPGDRVTCSWPNWGTWTGKVISYDEKGGTITLSDGWGDTASFAIGDVWLTPRTVEQKRLRRLYAILFVTGASVGAAIGALVTALIQ